MYSEIINPLKQFPLKLLTKKKEMRKSRLDFDPWLSDSITVSLVPIIF